MSQNPDLKLMKVKLDKREIFFFKLKTNAS